ncbi:MAG: ATP-binding protein [Pseudomonadota bacterium]
MSRVVDLTFLSDAVPEDLPAVVEAFADENALPPKTTFALDLVIEEITTNIANHAGPATVTLALTAADGVVTGSVRDNAPAFDPLARGPVDTAAGIDERAIGGLGIHLVKSMTDALTYAREDGHNVLTFTLPKKETP